MITRFSAHWRAKKLGTSAVPMWSRKLGEAYGVLAFSTHLEAEEAECPGGEGWQEQRWLWCSCIHQQAVKEDRQNRYGLALNWKVLSILGSVFPCPFILWGTSGAFVQMPMHLVDANLAICKLLK